LIYDDSSKDDIKWSSITVAAIHDIVTTWV